VCGVLDLRVEISGDRNGVFVVFPISRASLSVLVDIEEPGWVDFGRGLIPEELGVPILSDLDQLQLSRNDGASTSGDILASLQASSGESKFLIDVVTRIFRLDRIFKSSTSSNDKQGPTAYEVQLATKEPIDSRIWCQATKLRRLREGRGLSLRRAASLASSLEPPQFIGHAAIDRMERGENVKDSAVIASRIDVVCRADGRISNLTLDSSEDAGMFSVHFPSYWVGPVWIQMTAPIDNLEAELHLLWGAWQLRTNVRGNEVLTFRKSEPGGMEYPLCINHSEGWTIAAGLGRREDARDLNLGWYPTSKEFRRLILNQLMQMPALLGAKLSRRLRD
jgi:hypothetical protein